MTTTTWHPGPYTIKRFAQEVAQQLPPVTRGLPELFNSFVGNHKMDPAVRLAVQLRFARLMGCPVCAGFFPSVGPKVGLSPVAVVSAMNGEPDALTPEQYGAVVWAGELVQSDGVVPDEIPEPALAISQLLREQIALASQLELVVHATGLMFLPHGMIDRVAG